MTNTHEMPEMMTQEEYVAAQTALDRVSEIESAGSLHRTSKWQAEHIQFVRAAVSHRRSVHFENRSGYRNIIPGLRQYSLNQDVAVYDSSKVPGKLTAADIQFADYLAKKKERGA